MSFFSVAVIEIPQQSQLTDMKVYCVLKFQRDKESIMTVMAANCSHRNRSRILDIHILMTRTKKRGQ